MGADVKIPTCPDCGRIFEFCRCGGGDPPGYRDCKRLVRELAGLTGIGFTFGYIGNCDARTDDRLWYAFAPHPGRVGRAEDRIGGYRTHELDRLVALLRGAWALARIQARPEWAR